LEKLYCKTKISTITLILTLTISAILVALPTAAAQAQTKATYCFLGVTPNPVGVHQQVLLHVGIPDQLSSVEQGYEGLTITITDPEGIQSTIPNIRTDSTGGTGVGFTPDKVGNYTLQGHFPTQTVTITSMWGGGGDITFLDSDSEEVQLEVLSEDIEYHPGYSLPTEYWTRPIDAQLREWYTIAASWLYEPENRYITNNDGPETAHILWTTELVIGGMVGGDVGLAGSINQGAVGFGTGDAYEGLWSSRFILAGRLYYATYAAGALSMGVFPEPVEYHCVDLHTGEELWTKVFMDNATIDFAQLLYYQGFNYMGAFAYLYVAEGGGGFFFGPSGPQTWYAFNAYTGNLAFTVLNVPAGTTLRDANGGLYILKTDQTNGWMGQWNMTGFIEASATGYYVGGGSWGNVVNGMTFDAGADTAAAEEGWDWNVTISTDLQGSVRAVYFNDRVVGANIGSEEVSVWGINTEPGKEGQELFNTSWDAPEDWSTGNQTISWAADSEESLVGVLWSKELRQHYGISLENGELLWGPTPSQYYLDQYEGTMLTSHLMAYGRLYASGVAGILYCYNATTGDVLWTYPARDPYTEYLFGNNWWLGITFITDGKVYLGSAEHSANQPLPRGAPFVCVDAESGDLIWRANGLFRQTGWGGLAIIGDSIIATMDTYDQRMYAIGKGPSSTTVSIQNDVISLGSSVMIKGTVMDVSPGTEDEAIQLRFPNGVPAISDEDMSEWMLYVYKQFKQPENATGVEVYIKILDPNGDWYSTYVTTDENGVFSLMWAPAIAGEYHVTAMFEGSEAYYASQATTTFGVDEAAVVDVPSAAEIADTTVNKMPAYPAIPEIPAYLTIDLIIVIIAAVGVVIGLIAYMALRKQK
jgi:outer membrane protein assembly factor BamB